MHRLLKKNQILTIPNLLSVFRLALIPVIVWLYCAKGENKLAVAVIVLSGLTDVADGFIARRFNMVSDFGKILDPVADKLTQAAIVICLIRRYSLMKLLVLVLIVKEILMAALGYVTIKRKDSVNSSQWHGKLTTVLIYLVAILLFFFPNIPGIAANVMIWICVAMLLTSFLLYLRFYWKLLCSKEKYSHG